MTRNNPMDPDLLDGLLDQAFADGTVFSYFSLSRLLAAHPAEMRDMIREEFQKEGPIPEGEIFRVAWVRTDAMPDGTWCLRVPDERLGGYSVVIVSDSERYEGARVNLEQILARKQSQAPLN